MADPLAGAEVLLLPHAKSGWVSAELDPDLLRRVRESASFPLRKRPEAYGELTSLG